MQYTPLQLCENQMTRVLVPMTDLAFPSKLVAKNLVEQLLYHHDYRTDDIIYKERADRKLYRQRYNREQTLKLATGKYIVADYKEKASTIAPVIPHHIPEYPPIFKHWELGIEVRPVCQPVVMEIQLRMISNNYNDLEQFISMLRSQHWFNQPDMRVNLMYNYSVPDSILGYLYQAWFASENVEPLGQTIEEFTSDHFTEGVITRRDIYGKRPQLAINEKQNNCLALVTTMPEIIETDAELSRSEVTVTIELHYDKIKYLACEIQRYIHNQKINIDMLALHGVRGQLYRPNKVPDVFTGVHASVNPINGVDVVKVTDFQYDPMDQWTPPLTLPSISDLLVIPCVVDPLNPTDVLDLEEIDDYRLPPELMAIMRAYFDLLIWPTNFPILIELFAVGATLKAIPLIIDSNLHVRSAVPLDLRLRHYLRISILTDLSDAEIEALRHTPAMLLYLFQMINPNVIIGDEWLILLPDGSISPQSIRDTIVRLRTTHPEYRNHLDRPYIYLVKYASLRACDDRHETF